MSLLSPGKFGFLLAATGAAHFVVPEVFEDLTEAAFPDDTSEWIRRNGLTETALGVAVMAGPTRKLGFAGLLAYVGWLGYNVAQNR